MIPQPAIRRRPGALPPQEWGGPAALSRTRAVTHHGARRDAAPSAMARGRGGGVTADVEGSDHGR